MRNKCKTNMCLAAQEIEKRLPLNATCKYGDI